MIAHHTLIRNVTHRFLTATTVNADNSQAVATTGIISTFNEKRRLKADAIALCPLTARLHDRTSEARQQHIIVRTPCAPCIRATTQRHSPAKSLIRVTDRSVRDVRCKVTALYPIRTLISLF